MTTLFLDCFSGAAGDMILGALIDLGASKEEIRSRLHALALPGWELQIETVDRRGFRGTRASFAIDPHDRARTYPDVVAIVEPAALPAEVKKPALKTFAELAEAEASVHGTSRDEARFHEVGADDAILDVVGVFSALHSLRPHTVISSAVATGTGGMVETTNGVIPVPAPAVAELLRAHRVPVFGRGSKELLTPTGAAILVTASDSFGRLPEMSLEGVGYGAGSRDLAHPNLLRVMAGENLDRRREDATLMETNLDDMSPEFVPHVIERLLDSGARDAWVTAATMKKGRPGFVLSVLADPGRADALATIVFEETTTLGVRFSMVTREVLERDWIEVEVEGAPVRVKRGLRRGRLVSAAPEHDDARRAASATGLPLKEIYARALLKAGQAGND